MNLHYFNITYTCNQNCIYCYSHNTIHTASTNNEIALCNFENYLAKMEIKPSDRVILNGGEPFLHTQIVEILKYLKSIDCEVLIYTNGTLISNYNLDFLTNKFRFVIPVHGFAEMHDKITYHKGGFSKMRQSIKYLRQYDCLINSKLIINDAMISSDKFFHQTLLAMDSLEFNHAVHIRKMVDTITSKRNNFPSVSMDRAAPYTAKAFYHFKDKVCAIKLFDTCIKDIEIEKFILECPSICVYFKDWQHERQFTLKNSELECRQFCHHTDKCFSAVGSYIALEYRNGLFYKTLE